MDFLVGLIFVLAFAYGSYGTLGAVVVLVALAVGYAVSIRRKQYVQCRRCKGSPKKPGLVFTYAHGFCQRCGGSGQRDRFGSRRFVNRKT